MNEPAAILQMLGLPDRQPRSLAVVGLSDDPTRPSHSVSAYMQRAGYRIFPVNPSISEALGEPAFASLTELVSKRGRPDVVNVFRLPKAIPAIVDEMIALDLKNLWVQLGIMNHEAALRAESAGISVVMDRCILIEHSRLAR